ncbi:MAG TPA: hypothetical protein PLI68_01205 [Bacteroidia bacterium]|nr:hypothetical protein [Bacteroidia bacterium]HRH09275.1 hypothetical protein [Bacteroidia bacterium]HRH61920.1 hypothetical protein [Bacteroidia bacterium]
MISENTALRKTLFYFSLIMVFVYIALGIAIAFTTFLIDLVPNNRMIIGGILVIYGAFRLYVLNRQRKSYKFFQEQKSNNENLGN